MNLHRTRAVARKEFLHILRDPQSLFLALAIPALLLLLFGYALSLDVDRIPIVFQDADRTPQSRALIERFLASRYFALDASSKPMVQLSIQQGFARSVEAGQPVAVQMVLDGSDANTAGIARNYAEGILLLHSEELRTQRRLRAGQTRPPLLEARVRMLYNAELKSRNYIVPGLIAVILMLIACLLTALCVAREWENGSMEQLLSTPLRPTELLLGKLSAYFALGLVDMVLAIVAGIGLFGVPLRGNALLLFATGCIFLAGALSWGLFISVVTRHQLLAFQVSMTTSFLPAFLLSGFIYSIENMPQVVQIFTWLVPSRFFISFLKDIFLKGNGIALLWPQILFLVVYTALVFFRAVTKMKAKAA
jgi:ABC-2 type transport system permease protein